MSKLFPLLAVETSDELCSVSLHLSEDSHVHRSVEGKYVHSEKLIPMIEAILEEASIEVNQLGCIAVSEGPGSFTGLRIGMSAAKGIANGANLPLLPVPTFDALAFTLAGSLPENQNFIIAKKANREEVYLAQFEATVNSYKHVIELRLINENEIESFMDEAHIVYGINSLEKFGIDQTRPTALDIGKWAYKFGKDLLTSNYDLIEPNYLKKFVVKEKK